MNTAGAVASIVSPMLTGFIANNFGFTASLVIGGLMMVGAALSVLFFLTEIKPMDIGTSYQAYEEDPDSVHVHA